MTPGDVLEACGVAEGELDLLEGSPPCTAFSMAGDREKGWGREVDHGGGRQRVEDLFFEWLRLLEGTRPRAFVAENVAGMVRGQAVGYFDTVLLRMRELGYRARARVLDAQWLGVPQARQRLFFVGVREDLGAEPPFPRPLAHRYSLRDALGDRVQGLAFVGPGHFREGQASSPDEPCPTLMARGLGGVREYQVAVVEDPVWFQKNAIFPEWLKLLPGEQSDRYFNLVRPALDRPCPTVSASGGGSGTASVTHPLEPRKFTIEELKLISSCPADYELRGRFVDQWKRLGNCVPPLMMRAVAEGIRDTLLGAR